MKSRGWQLWSVLTAVGLIVSPLVALADKCATCQQEIQQRIYLYSNPHINGKQTLCETCVKLDVTCSICGLPIKSGGRDLKDSRWLCRDHAKTAITSPDHAKNVFDEVKRDVMGMFAGAKAYPDHNITLTLVDLPQLEALHRVQRFPHTRNLTLGLTRSRETEAGKWEHQIHILLGLHPSRYKSVSAHEYTHAWLHENVTAGRQLDSDTVEGFCELIAYKYALQTGDTLGQTLVLTNNYTRGQIDAFVKAEQQYQFYRVMKWTLAGVDEQLDINNLPRILKLSEPAPTEPSWPVYNVATAPKVGWTNLVLKAISGTRQRRFAMVNDRTLSPNETGKVTLGSSNVQVKCLEIKDRSVVVQVNGGAKTELVMRDVD